MPSASVHRHRSVVMGLSPAGLDDLDAGRHRIADVDGRRIVPLLVEEDAARSRQLLCHERVEEAGRQTAVDDASLRTRVPAREGVVEVQRVVVAGQCRRRPRTSSSVKVRVMLARAPMPVAPPGSPAATCLRSR